MSLFHGDIIIKTAIELILEDMRKNPWLIEDCFASLLENPLLKERYGMGEIERAKEFILNNKVSVFLKERIDKQHFPCVTIAIGSSEEASDLATLGDLSTEVQELDPEKIGKPIRYIVPPFNVISYDKDTGIVEIPEDIVEYRYISQGMIAIDPNTGNGVIVQEKAGENGFRITPGLDLPGSKLGIIPQYQLYRARRERAMSRETYHIGCHSHGDPSTLIYLFSVVKYGLYRYREALLEREGFQVSRIAATDIIQNSAFDIENIFSRFITLSGIVEECWIKVPHRIIEAIDLAEQDGQSLVLTSGIKILSQQAPEEFDPQEELWITVDEE